MDFVADPGHVAALRDAIDRGAQDPVALLEACFARIEEAEGAVQGWRIVDGDGAMRQAERLRARTRRGPLHGIPVAVKDVIDVAGFPTRAGSRSREHAPAATCDAQVVTRLREAGAIILGKAHTTEFAFFDGPPPTRNPYDLRRTPGGSSSGPAAIVAAGMAPLALGTQTAGSVSRPAAYCGIAAFKPSTQAWSGHGVVPFAPSFDTVGVFGYRVADAVLASRALMPAFLAGNCAQKDQPRIAVLADPLLATATEAVTALTGEVARKLRDAGGQVQEVASPADFARLNEWHLVMREYELGHAQADLLATPDGAIMPSLREAITRGLGIDDAHYLAAGCALAEARQRFWETLGAFDAIVVPAAPDVAPEGMATGDPRFIVPVTALSGPIVSVPVGFDAGMPLGVMLCAAPGRDAALLAVAECLGPTIEVPR